MTPVAISLVLLSGLALAVRDFLSKRSGDKYVFVWAYNMLGILLLFPVSLYYALTSEGSLGGVLFGLASGIFGGWYFYFLALAYDHGDLSHVFPIIRSAPAVVLLLSVIFLDEKVVLTGVVGILCVTFGVYMVNLTSLRLRTFFEPMQGLLRDRASLYALIAMLMSSGYALMDKAGLVYLNPLVYVFITQGVATVFLSFGLLKNKKHLLVRDEWARFKKSIFVNAILAEGGYSLLLIALQFTNVSYVVGLRQVSILFAMLLGAYSLQEKHRAVRLTAGAVIMCGLFLIAIS